jgi:hypothetical protein
LVQNLVSCGFDDYNVDGALFSEVREGFLQPVSGLVGLGERKGTADENLRLEVGKLLAYGECCEGICVHSHKM